MRQIGVVFQHSRNSITENEVPRNGNLKKKKFYYRRVASEWKIVHTGKWVVSLYSICTCVEEIMILLSLLL